MLKQQVNTLITEMLSDSEKSGLRVIGEVYSLVKKYDPDTSLKLCGLRAMVKSGKIPAVSQGNKTLLTYNNVMKYLSNPEDKGTGNPVNMGQIRPVKI